MKTQNNIAWIPAHKQSNKYYIDGNTESNFNQTIESDDDYTMYYSCPSLESLKSLLKEDIETAEYLGKEEPWYNCILAVQVDEYQEVDVDELNEMEDICRLQSKTLTILCEVN